MEARAMYVFDASQEDELSFKPGDNVKVKNMEDKNWYQAELNGRVGFIPRTYVKMENHDWYKGKMTRIDAEGFLKRTDANGHHLYPDGAFIVRDCEADKNHFSLSVKHGSGAQHFKILFSDGEYYLWPTKRFSSINQLIAHYRTVSIAREPRVTILLKDLQENPVTFEAQHDFQPETPDEMEFRRGDRLVLQEKVDPNWWKGRNLNTNREGLFPCNYVRELPPC